MTTEVGSVETISGSGSMDCAPGVEVVISGIGFCDVVGPESGSRCSEDSGTVADDAGGAVDADCAGDADGAGDVGDVRVGGGSSSSSESSPSERTLNGLTLAVD